MGGNSMGEMGFWRGVLDWIRERNLQHTTIVLVGGGWFMQMVGRTLKGLNVPMLQRTLFAGSLAEARQKLRAYRKNHPRTQSTG
jgi:ferredoxin-NADP reductase